MAILVMICQSSTDLRAQTNVAPSAGKSANRYLFIVETSRAMRPRAQGVYDAVKQALDSSLNGRIQKGDWVGIWTFNENVYQELFPLQEWWQPTQLAFAVRLPTLADPEIYQKRGRLEKVVPEMSNAISESKNLTVILVSAGEGVLQGTPFSAQINSAWKEWHDEQEGVHMPLLTVLRTRNGQHTDWLLTPAPRPIELPADSEVANEKENNPSGVILESGLVSKKPDSTVLGPEQQVAFSVWALGKTGSVSAASSPQNVSVPKADAPAPSATPSRAGSASEQSSTSQAPEHDSSKVAAVVPLQEDAQSAPASSRTSGTEERQIPKDTQLTASPSKAPPDVGKPVELLFVTNAPVQSSAIPEPSADVSKPAETPPSVEVTAAPVQPKDVTSGQQLLAHARASDPEAERRALDPALPAPRQSFLRENINSLVLMIAAAFGAAYCLRMWFLTQARVTGNALSLTRTSKGE